MFENQAVGSVIFDGIEAHDLDGPLFNEITFSTTSNLLFQVKNNRYISNGKFAASVILESNLDYETSRSHVVTILATGTNSAFITSTEVFINVLDYPDRPPEFSQSPYYVKIEEEMEQNAFVLQVFARDGDTGVNNQCKYKIIYGMYTVTCYSFILNI